MSVTLNEKDRRTRMVASSIKAPPKKGGAGGQFTWGSATEVDWYDPVGLAAAPTVGVVTAPATPVVMTTAPMQMVTTSSAVDLNVRDRKQFPTLGAPTVPLSARTVTGGVWASPPAAPPVLNDNFVRAGMVGQFDAQHPRNMFAKKPHVITTAPSEQQQQVPAIDWSNDGIPKTVQQSIVRSMANPAHLSPYVQQAQPTPVSSLRAVPQPQQIIPVHVKQPIMVQKPNIIKQPGFRR